MTAAEYAVEFLKGLLITANEPRESRYKSLGTPPLWMIVEQREPSGSTNFNTGSMIQRWRVSLTGVDREPIGQILPPQVKVGMYYDYGKADFSVLTEKKLIRLGWQIGPRYGRGYDIPYTESENGITAGIPVGTWMS